jgi:hypothetical protein
MFVAIVVVVVIVFVIVDNRTTRIGQWCWTRRWRRRIYHNLHGKMTVREGLFRRGRCRSRSSSKVVVLDVVAVTAAVVVVVIGRVHGEEVEYCYYEIELKYIIEYKGSRNDGLEWSSNFFSLLCNNNKWSER